MRKPRRSKEPVALPPPEDTAAAERYAQSGVAFYDAAIAALSTATLADANEMLAQADSVELYAKKARDPDLVKHAVAVSLAAQRRAGELLRQMADEGAREARGGDRKSKFRAGTLKLDDLGVSKKQSQKWQQLAGLSRPDFEERVAERQQEALRALDGSRAERQAEKKAKRQEREQELAENIRALPGKKYGVIYADPEWKFEVYSQESGLDRAADNHYPTSDLDAICARDVASIAADDCALFLWVTTPMLGAFPRVLAAWGFIYKSCIVWAKDRTGTGYWTRDRAEHLIIATRGNVPCPAMGDQCESLIEAPVGVHSCLHYGADGALRGHAGGCAPRRRGPLRNGERRGCSRPLRRRIFRYRGFREDSCRAFRRDARLEALTRAPRDCAARDGSAGCSRRWTCLDGDRRRP